VKHSLLPIAAAIVLSASVGVASAQENPAKQSWTTTQGETLTTTYRMMHYAPYNDPAMHPQTGMVLPGTVHVYLLPESMNVRDGASSATRANCDMFPLIAHFSQTVCYRTYSLST
jgi:hypothetical protein